MSVSWSSRIALPGSRQECGHPRCGRLTVAAGMAIAGSCGVVIAGAASCPGRAALIVAVSLVIAAAGLVLGCWPHPREDDTQALIEAVSEHPPPRPLPRKWTGADWAELERELSR